MDEESVPTVGADSAVAFDPSESDALELSEDDVLRLARRCASA